MVLVKNRLRYIVLDRDLQVCYGQVLRRIVECPFPTISKGSDIYQWLHVLGLIYNMSSAVEDMDLLLNPDRGMEQRRSTAPGFGVVRVPAKHPSEMSPQLLNDCDVATTSLISAPSHLGVPVSWCLIHPSQ